MDRTACPNPSCDVTVSRKRSYERIWRGLRTSVLPKKFSSPLRNSRIFLVVVDVAYAISPKRRRRGWPYMCAEKSSKRRAPVDRESEVVLINDFRSVRRGARYTKTHRVVLSNRSTTGSRSPLAGGRWVASFGPGCYGRCRPAACKLNWISGVSTHLSSRQQQAAHSSHIWRLCMHSISSDHHAKRLSNPETIEYACRLSAYTYTFFSEWLICWNKF